SEHRFCSDHIPPTRQSCRWHLHRSYQVPGTNKQRGNDAHKSLISHDRFLRSSDRTWAGSVPPAVAGGYVVDVLAMAVGLVSPPATTESVNPAGTVAPFAIDAVKQQSTLPDIAVNPGIS